MKQKHKLTINVLDFDDIRNPLLNAGQARATYEICRRMVADGHEVTVISSKYPGYRDRKEKGIFYRHIGFGTGNIKLNNLLYILSVPFAVAKIRADVIIECFTPPFSTLFSPLFTRIPVVAVPTMFAADEFSAKYHLPFYLVERIGCRLYRYFAPYLPSDVRKLKIYNRNFKYRYIPPGTGNEYFLIRKKSPRHILYIGRFDIQQKGIDLLLKSYAGIKNKIGYPLVIAGHGPDTVKIKALINQLGLNRNVILTGAAYGQKKIMLMSRALFVTMPSRHEGFSLFALEALAAGLPIVRFNISGLSWMGGRVSLETDAFNTDDYGKKMLKAATGRLNKTLSRNARLFARKFSWNTVSRNFEIFLSEIAAG